MARAAIKAPPLQGRGWGGGITGDILCETPPHPRPLP